MSTARRGRSASRKEEGNRAMGPDVDGPHGYDATRGEVGRGRQTPRDLPCTWNLKTTGGNYNNESQTHQHADAEEGAAAAGAGRAGEGRQKVWPRDVM